MLKQLVEPTRKASLAFTEARVDLSPELSQALEWRAVGGRPRVGEFQDERGHVREILDQKHLDVGFLPLCRKPIAEGREEVIRHSEPLASEDQDVRLELPILDPTEIPHQIWVCQRGAHEEQWTSGCCLPQGLPWPVVLCHIQAVVVRLREDQVRALDVSSSPAFSTQEPMQVVNGETLRGAVLVVVSTGVGDIRELEGPLEKIVVVCREKLDSIRTPPLGH